jgi:hypothetical protein
MLSSPGWVMHLVDYIGGLLTAIAYEQFFNWLKKRKTRMITMEATKRFKKYVKTMTSLPTVQNFEFIQVGPENGFDSDGISAIIEGGWETFPEVLKIVKTHEAQWKGEGLWNGDYLGVAQINLPRHGAEEVPEIVFILRQRKFFEYLATNAQVCLRNDLNEPERKWLESEKATYSQNAPNVVFVNPLSVEVLLLCKGKTEETKAVLGVRSSKTAFRGGMLQPSASEAVGRADCTSGGDKCDVLNACYRGLEEELGLPRQQIVKLCLTSLIFDKQEYDYELTAVAYTDLDEDSIKQNWLTVHPGKDKVENKEIEFRPFPIEQFGKAEISRWTHQAFVAYLMALYQEFGFEVAIEKVKV